MKFNSKGLAIEELFFKMNINFDPGKTYRVTNRLMQNEQVLDKDGKILKITLTAQNVADEGDEQPYEYRASVFGVFEVEDVTDAEKKDFILESIRILHPFLRAAVANLTVNAYVPPVILPVLTDIIFNEKDAYEFVVDDKNIN